MGYYTDVILGKDPYLFFFLFGGGRGLNLIMFMIILCMILYRVFPVI